MNDEDLTLKIPIPTTVRQKAKQFAAAQPTPEKAARVYRQTLAVFAVVEYLGNWLGYDVPQEESLNPVTRTLSDSADIWIAGIGRIECLVAEPDAETCPLPPAAQEGRIGYLVVEMPQNKNEDKIEAKQVRLLGFAPMFDPEDVPDEVELEELASLDEMVDYFHRLERGMDELKKIQSNPKSNPKSNPEPDEHQQLMVVAMLERIYRQEKPNRWGIKAARVLSGSSPELAAVRENNLSGDLVARQEDAEALMQRLANVWQSNL